jgi:hypothetical protein
MGPDLPTLNVPNQLRFGTMYGMIRYGIVT